MGKRVARRTSAHSASEGHASSTLPASVLGMAAVGAWRYGTGHVRLRCGYCQREWKDTCATLAKKCPGCGAVDDLTRIRQEEIDKVRCASSLMTPTVQSSATTSTRRSTRKMAKTPTKATTKRSAPKAAAPTQAQVEESEQSLAEKRLSREPSAMHTALRDFIEQETGYEADIKTVQLVCNMRRAFQRSDVHAQLEAEAAQAREAKAAAKATKAATATTTKKTAPAGAKGATRPATKGTAAKGKASTATARKGRTKAAAADEDPFE